MSHTAGHPVEPLRPLALRLLGVPAWRMGSGRWVALARKDAVLLAALALDGQQPRTGVAAWLWPGVPLPRAHANLRQRLFRLRRQAGELIDESGEGLRLAADVQCDVRRDGCRDDADLSAALLGGLAGSGDDDGDDDAVQRWIDEARRQWAARRADLLGGLAARHETAGALAAALAATEQLLAIEPLMEHAWRRLMRLHGQRGDRAAALAAFERCERVLRDELGVKPAPETQALLHRLETLVTAGAQATGTPLPPALLHPPRLVGREAERRAVAAAWQAGAAFVLVGEAGLGKSRLLGELASEGPCRVLESARPGDEAVAYGALVRLLRTMQRVATRPELLWPQGPARQELARLLPELGPAPPAPGLEALLQGALEQVFAAGVAAGLQAVLFDDLQHADEATRAVLRRVVPCGAAQPGLRWGFASRPDARSDLAGWLASSARLAPITLAGLSDAHLHDLLASLNLPALPALDAAALVPALARHCGGNPLFVLETLKHLVLQGAQNCQGGGHLPLPASVAAMLAQRLAQLSESARNLARVAAVAGADFSAEVAADVLETSLAALAGPWAELQQAQVLREAAAGFAHEAVHDAVLHGLPRALQGPLHARVAASLMRGGAPPQRVASHFAAAGDTAAAAPQALAAADQALRLGRTAERLVHLRLAVQWFEAAGDSAGAFDARVASVAACLAHEGLAPATALAAALAPQARTREQRLALRLAQAGVGLASYNAGLTLEAAAAALAEAEPGSEDHLSAQALQAAGRAMAGDTTSALAAVQALRVPLAAVRSPLRAAGLWGHCAVVFNSAGRTADCMAALERQRRFANLAGHAELEASALASLSAQHASMGESELAIATGRDACALHRRMGADNTAVICDINLGIALIGASQLREALALLDAASAHVQRSAGEGDLRLIVADLRAEIWLRVAQPLRALQELADEPAAGLNLPRRLNRLAMRAQAAQLLGDGELALALWRQLRQQVPPGRGSGLQLRSRALASVGLPGAAARTELDAVLRQAQATRFPAGQALARMRRAAVALRDGDTAQALADARALRVLREQARHLFVSEAELRALVCRVLDASGHGAQAAAERRRGAEWVARHVLPHLPVGCADSWRAHPAHQALWA